MSYTKFIIVALLTAVGVGTTALTVSNTVALTSVFDGNTVFQNIPYKMSQDEVCSILKIRLQGQPKTSYFYKIATRDFERTCSKTWDTNPK
jgi:hypothetical protein